jgi:TPR repeat protein
MLNDNVDFLMGHELYQNLVRGDAAIGLIADVAAAEKHMMDALWRAAGTGLAAAYVDLGDCYFACLRPIGAFEGAAPEDAATRTFSEGARAIADEDDASLEAAMRCYWEAAKLGHRDSLIRFAQLTRNSRAENQEIAAKLLTELASPSAKDVYQLGLIHHWLGRFSESAEVHKRAASLGSADAQFELYIYFAQGIGVEADAAKSDEWLQKAAASNHPRALYNLGAAFASGSAGEVDMAKAASYYERASEAGNGRAAGMLGIMALTGDIEGGSEKAIEWLDQADELGFPTWEMLDASGLDDPRS